MIDFSDPRQLMGILQNPGRVASLLKQDPGTGATPAAIFADVFTTMRADTAQLAEQHGIEMDVEKMSEDRAAELLSSVISGEGAALVAAFNREAERRDRVLRAALDDDEYQQFMAAKLGALETDADGDFATEDLEADADPVNVQKRLRDDSDANTDAETAED